MVYGYFSDFALFAKEKEKEEEKKTEKAIQHLKWI